MPSKSLLLVYTQRDEISALKTYLHSVLIVVSFTLTKKSKQNPSVDTSG